MPALAEASAITPSASKMENKNSIKVLDDLMAKLSVSKAQDEVNAATHNIATFINGPIEERDAPTKYVFLVNGMLSKPTGKKEKIRLNKSSV
jgi:elongation factor 3